MSERDLIVLLQNGHTAKAAMSNGKRSGESRRVFDFTGDRLQVTMREIPFKRPVNTKRLSASVSVAAFLGLMFVSCSQPKGTAVFSPENEARALKQLELAAMTAEFRLDTGTIANLMHEDFLAIDADKLQGKQAELDGIYRGRVQARKDGVTVDSLYLDDFRAGFFNDGKTAVVAFYSVSQGTQRGVRYENLRWRWYDVWVKEQGEWKLASIQGTPAE